MGQTYWNTTNTWVLSMRGKSWSCTGWMIGISPIFRQTFCELVAFQVPTLFFVVFNIKPITISKWVVYGIVLPTFVILSDRILFIGPNTVDPFQNKQISSTWRASTVKWVRALVSIHHHFQYLCYMTRGYKQWFSKANCFWAHRFLDYRHSHSHSIYPTICPTVKLVYTYV